MDIECLHMLGKLSELAHKLSLLEDGYEKFGGCQLDACIMVLQDADCDTAHAIRSNWMLFQSKFYEQVAKEDFEAKEIHQVVELVKDFFHGLVMWVRSTLAPPPKKDEKRVSFSTSAASVKVLSQDTQELVSDDEEEEEVCGKKRRVEGPNSPIFGSMPRSFI